ncbi:uncharacterized protein BT62DRAFT_879574 [Guyanagaster necrorhizus]|uniref:Uncharacterized protein n=1 Tax=Guyanagaster necrorhizus TaxID=856835 RepID=A0A9P8AYF9_9AGAR|nr:uncharacterized protein BT62DRAFT_879574 [Guyanagaster necrorhizus MCA 3950]KAG7452854.1 hypothetical protein BT62DRAFT_879574 [Guyanagaster necrorhizus MCA 3950]
MNGRLASFRGPSTPTSSPVQRQPTTPKSPARATETTYHRKLRAGLLELRGITETWDDLVLVDGLKAAKSLVDTRTELDNALSLIQDRRPRTRIVGPKLMIMDKRISELDAVIAKLQKQFRRMNTVIDTLEGLVTEAHKNKGWHWVQHEPLWVTWPLNKFVTSLPDILPTYHRELIIHMELVEVLRSHSISFDDSRNAITKWAEQLWIEVSGWEAKWEDVCAAEVDRWEGS